MDKFKKHFGDIIIKNLIDWALEIIRREIKDNVHVSVLSNHIT